MRFYLKALRILSRQSLAMLCVESMILVGVIGLLDYATGYEVTFFPFYAIPILLALWQGGHRLAIFISILSSLAWLWADTASGHLYSREWLRFWDASVRFMFFALIVAVGSAVRRRQEENRARIELLEQFQKLEQQIITISEREQERIGRDLHDGLGQHLVAIALAAESLRDDLAADFPGPAKSVGLLAGLLLDAVSMTRNLAKGLSPVDRDEGGLESALENMAITVTNLSGILCTYSAQGPDSTLSPSTAVHLFRIAQEAANNALKHSRANGITISLATSEHSVKVSVADNGIGFAKDAQDCADGMGLNIMRYRAQMIGGTLSIERNHPSGIVVTCSVPVENE